ncbi:PREDICTED: probable serine/threonine-protein kinase kinX [Camelina sativa]|uniref:Probable serine/threonine-protein kinase kinX n=1 Tax=Camelina sativa TaxID=90675 RepID=A0ABM0T3R4_CAMSA|nr:PREDICTED: probable serine/threonine-protein kinase kinX [Camelina sativa]
MARSLKKSAKLSLRRVRINSPSIRFKPDSSSIERDQRIEFLPENGDDAGSVEEETKEENNESEEAEEKEEEERVKVIVEEEEEEEEQDDGKSFHNGCVEGKNEAVAAVEAVEEEEGEGGNRVMVVVDKALASTGALEWAITHTLQPQDTLFLLYFAKPFRKSKRKNRKREVKTDELVHTLKKLCQTKRPGIEVEIRRLEGKDKDKGQKIVEEAKKQQVSLLVVGQEKKPPVWRLLKRWAWKRRRGHGGVLKYCLENASCMTIAVKPKNRKLGGYLITTKRHKNFWLLA